jgi:hypothetical protein
MASEFIWISHFAVHVWMWAEPNPEGVAPIVLHPDGVTIWPPSMRSGLVVNAPKRSIDERTAKSIGLCAFNLASEELREHFRDMDGGASTQN